MSKKVPPVRRQKIPASEMERGIIVKRALEAQKAEDDFVLAQNRSNEVFGIFCESRGLPRGCVLVGTDKAGNIIVDLPKEEKESADGPKTDKPAGSGK